MDGNENEKHWYIVHTYAGHEERVEGKLKQRIKFMDAEGKIADVIIPTEDEIEIHAGQRRVVTKKVFPGYILVKMGIDEQSWDVVRNTPGITGFVGNENKPTPIPEQEVEAILKRMHDGTPQVKVGLARGQSVRIVDGPFIDFVGIIEELNPDRGKVQVLLTMFGRETPVELDLLQVEKL
ncbi:MAG: transcription termination/antitermination protein NusG [Chloroflexota bacterium]